MTQTMWQAKSLPCKVAKPLRLPLRTAVLLGFLLILKGDLTAQFEYDWPAQSALSEGQWYRIATVRSGFHRVDTDLLS